MFGAIVGGTIQAASAAASASADAKQARLNRQFQRNMSNTAYQRARADMEKAGINPMLLAGGAQAASTPSGSKGNVPMADVMGGAAKGASLALVKGQARKTNAEADSAEYKATRDRAHTIPYQVGGSFWDKHKARIMGDPAGAAKDAWKWIRDHDPLNNPESSIELEVGPTGPSSGKAARQIKATPEPLEQRVFPKMSPKQREEWRVLGGPQGSKAGKAYIRRVAKKLGVK